MLKRDGGTFKVKVVKGLDRYPAGNMANGIKPKAKNQKTEHAFTLKVIEKETIKVVPNSMVDIQDEELCWVRGKILSKVKDTDKIMASLNGVEKMVKLCYVKKCGEMLLDQPCPNTGKGSSNLQIAFQPLSMQGTVKGWLVDNGKPGQKLSD